LNIFLFSAVARSAPLSTLFPYTTLFRSKRTARNCGTKARHRCDYCGKDPAAQSGALAGGIELARSRWNPRTAVVPAFALCGALHLRAPGVPRADRSGGKTRLEAGVGPGGARPARAREEYRIAAKGQNFLGEKQLRNRFRTLCELATIFGLVSAICPAFAQQ